MSGFRVHIRVEVKANTSAYPGPPPLVHVERSAIISRGRSEDEHADLYFVGEDLAKVISGALDEAQAQLVELGNALPPPIDVGDQEAIR